MSKSNRIGMALVYGFLWYLLMYFQLVFLSEQVDLTPLHYLLALLLVLVFSFLYQWCCFIFGWYLHAILGFLHALGLSVLLYLSGLMGETFFPYYSFFLNTWLYCQATFLSLKAFTKPKNIDNRG